MLRILSLAGGRGLLRRKMGFGAGRHTYCAASAESQIALLLRISTSWHKREIRRERGQGTLGRICGAFASINSSDISINKYSILSAPSKLYRTPREFRSLRSEELSPETRKNSEMVEKLHLN